MNSKGQSVIAQSVNVQAGNDFHQFVHLNTFSASASLPKEKFTPHWHLPKLMGNFTGRGKELTQLEQFFTLRHSTTVITHSQAVCGTGGIGKTQLAIKFAHDAIQSKRFDVVIWFRHDLSSEFRTLGHSLGIMIDNVSNADIAKQTYTALSKMGKVLVIIDDVPRGDFLESYQPADHLNISVLMTTRDATPWGKGIHPLMLGIFNPTEAKDYIEKVLRNNQCPEKYSEEEAEKLAEMLGYFPLALSHAVAHIVKPRGSIAQFMSLFQSKRKSALSSSFENDPHAMNVWVTVNLCVEKIQRRSLNILQACSYVAAEDPINQALLGLWMGDNVDCQEAIDELCQYSLVENCVAPRHVKIHQMVQDVLKMDQTLEVIQESLIKWANLINLYSNGPAGVILIPLDEIGYIPLKPHSISLIRQIKQQPRIDSLVEAEASMNVIIGVAHKAQGKDQESKFSFECALTCEKLRSERDEARTAVALMGIATAMMSIGEPNEAKRHHETALSMLKAVRGENHLEVGVCLSNLGGATLMCGDPKNAMRYFEAALPILQQNLGKAHNLVGNCLLNIGWATVSCGDFQGGKNHLENALNILRVSLGESNIAFLRCRVNFGSVLLLCGEPHNAKKELEAVLPKLQTFLGENHGEVGVCMMNLGYSTVICGDAPGGKQLLETALPILKTYLGGSHAHVGRCLASLSTANLNCGDPKTAKQHLEVALPILQEALGDTHADVGRCWMNLALANIMCGDYQSANEQLNIALPVLKVCLGEGHEDVGRCLSNLGTVTLHCEGPPQDAKIYLEAGLSILRSTKNEHQPDYARGMLVLGVTLLILEDVEIAKMYIEEALSLLRNHFGDRHLDVARGLRNLGMVHLELDNIEAAEVNFREAINIEESMLGRDHIETASSLFGMALVYREQKKLVDSLSTLLQVEPIFKQHYGEDHPRTEAVAQSILEVKEQIEKENKKPVSPRAHLKTQFFQENSNEMDASILVSLLRGEVPVNTSTALLLAKECEDSNFPLCALLFISYVIEQNECLPECYLMNSRCFLALKKFDKAQVAAMYYMESSADELMGGQLLEAVAKAIDMHEALKMEIQRFAELENATINDKIKKLVIALIRSCDYMKARQLIESLILDTKDNQLLGPLYYQLSMCYRGLHLYTEAREFITISLTYANNPRAVDLQIMLEKEQRTYELVCQALRMFGLVLNEQEVLDGGNVKRVAEMK